MSTPAQHTAIPWEVKEIFDQIYIGPVTPTEIDCIVCDLRASETDTPEERARMLANAEFIVRACNAHEELIEALNNAKNELSTLLDEYMNNTRVGACPSMATIQQCRAAIVKAEGD